MDMEDFCLSLRCHRQWTLLSAGRWVSRAATNVSEQRLSLIDQLPSTNFIKDLVVERCSVALRRRSGRTAQRLISNEAIPFVVSQPVLSEVEGNHERSFHTVWRSGVASIFRART